MRRSRAVVAGLSLLASLPVAWSATAAEASPQPQSSLVSANPVDYTPHVLDGSVKAVVQAGGMMVIAGEFSQVQPADGSPAVQRMNIVAFDAATGALSTTFVPSTDAEVTTLLLAADGQSIYAGGFFDTVSGQPSKSLARLNLSDGSLVASFHPPAMDGRVKDLRLSGGRLWVAGTFATIGGLAQPALATVNPDSGSVDAYMGLTFAGPYRDGALQVLKMDVTPSGSRLVAIGNFATVNGQSRPQLVMLDLTGGTAALADWATQQYLQDCGVKFDSYMRDVDLAPDGSFFVISTTGGYGTGVGSPCDTTMRWETGAVGSGLMPSWVDYTGGDTTYAVTVTGPIVYVGGHFRWQNNPLLRAAPGEGAVSREGIAALDSSNGLPLSWNPGRTKGVGVFDLLPTPTGLWVASDTDRIGNFEYHGRIAYFPLLGGSPLPAALTGTLPGHIFLAATGRTPTADDVVYRYFDGTTPSAATTLPPTGVAWRSSRGSAMIDGNVYTAWSDGGFDRRTFDGSTFGPAVAADTADELTRQVGWHTDAAKITGLFFDRGRMYYTLTGTKSLYYRYFTSEDDVVGTLRYTASANVTGVDFSKVNGMFVTGGKLYFVTSGDGALHRADWNGSAPVPGTAIILSSPSRDGTDWRAKSLFLYTGTNLPNPNQPPTARLTISCTGLTCAADGSASTPGGGGPITSYGWDFGDATTGTGAQVSHTYAAGGTYAVNLTVGDGAGRTGTAGQQVSVSAAVVGFVGAATVTGNASSYSVTVPAAVGSGNGLVLVLTTAVDVTASDPSGWQRLGSVSLGVGNGQSTVWQKVAVAGDAGTTVTVPLSGLAKAGLTVLAYSGTSAVGPVTSLGSLAETQLRAQHTTPAVTGVPAGSWVLSYWGEKSSATTAWTAPPGEQVRANNIGTGNGRIDVLATDSGAAVPTGDRAGLTATASSASGRAAMWSLVLAPGA